VLRVADHPGHDAERQGTGPSALGKDLGLDAQWAYRIVKQVGNYGEIFERNVDTARRISAW
jgi:hypothetical protein